MLVLRNPIVMVPRDGQNSDMRHRWLLRVTTRYLAAVAGPQRHILTTGERATSSLRSYDRMGHRQHRRTRGAHGRGSMFGWRVRGARPTRLWGDTGGVLPVGCAFAGRGFRRGRARLFADDRQRSPDLRLIAVGDEKYKRESALRRPYEARLRLAATARHGRRCLNPDS